MEDANLYTKQHQQQVNPSKFYQHFLYKTLIISTFLIILAIFPSQAPNFINQTLNTRGWEVLQLVFVGIAISYGLFSRRIDDEPEKENKNNNYYSNAQSYVSRLIQCSIFGEEADIPTGSSSSSSDGEKFQSWSNQYLRNDPMVVVAEENPVLNEEENSIISSIASEKLLLLPVRRLKSHSLGADQVVGPSPSPLRSIPGRIYIGDDDHPEAQASMITSPRKLASSASFSSETRGKMAEDFVRKKGLYRPPPPPPPPPQLFRKAVSMKERYRVANHEDEDDDHHQVIFPEKDLRRSFSVEAAKGSNFPRSVRTIRSGDRLAGPRKDKDLEVDKRAMAESEEEDDNAGCAYGSMAAAGSGNDEEGAGQGSSGDGGPDVDKKADEFIARFREQIRLQRIESIKSGQFARNFSS